MFRVKFFLFGEKNNRFGVKFLVLRVILSEYGVTFLN